MAITIKKAIWDYGVNSNLDTNNNLIIYQNEEAVNNAIKNFFLIGESEILNQPDIGGALLPYLFKGLEPDMVREMVFYIRAKLDNEFFPAVTLNTIEIHPDFDLRQWNVTLRYTIEEFKIEKTVKLELTRVQLRRPEEEMQNISLTGSKLYSFVIAYLYEMFGISIKWNGYNYQWGDRFTFTAMTPDDEYYNRIMEIVDSNR